MLHCTIIDIGTDEDAGEWLSALPYVHFDVREHAANDVTEPFPVIPGLGGGEAGDLGEGDTFHEGETSNG